MSPTPRSQTSLDSPVGGWPAPSSPSGPAPGPSGVPNGHGHGHGRGDGNGFEATSYPSPASASMPPGDPGAGRSQSFSAPSAGNPPRVVIPAPGSTGPPPALPDPSNLPVPAPMPGGPPARRDDGRPRQRQGPGGPGGPGGGKSGQRPKQGAGKSTKSTKGKKPPAKNASRSGGPSSSGRRPAQKAHPAVNWNKLAPGYDIDGPKVRLGVLWFLVAFPAVVASPATAGLLYGVVAGFAARQIVQAWRNEPAWQADVAAGLAGVSVLAAVGGTSTFVLVLGVAVVAAAIAGFQGTAAGLRGSGHTAAAGVMVAAIVPVAIAGASMVLIRASSPTAAGVLILFASAYEVGDFLIGSGGSTPIEGPLAGGAALVVTGFPMALLLVEPFDVLGVWMLGVAALCCPVGQWIASAVLPRPDAKVPALRRMDTLLLLAPVWVVANAAL